MQEGTRTAGYQAMAEWLEQQERRLRALEEENRELRRQLGEMRRGMGIAVVIEGRTIPLAALAEVPGTQPSQGITGGGDDLRASQWGRASVSSGAPTQVYPATGHPSFGPIPPAQRDPAPAAPGGTHSLAAVPRRVSQPPAPQHPVPPGPHQMQLGPQRQTYPPLAASPDQLPPPAQLQPTSSEGSFGMSEPWPGPSARDLGSAQAPARGEIAYPPSRRFDSAHPLWSQPESPRPARNPFADSFML